MTTIAEQLVYNTARIECVKADGRQSVGSGFFINFDPGGRGSVTVLVSNKHVINGAKSGAFYFNEQGEDGAPLPNKHFPVSIPSEFTGAWIGHPDPSIDLAMLPVGPFIHQARAGGRIPYFKAFTREFVASKEELESLTPIENITVIGYPNGIWDHVNGMPIVRQGSTATHPKLWFHGAPDFLIDCAIYPGSSGSPVVLFNPMGYATADGMVMGSRLKLIGVVHKVANHNAEGDIEFRAVPTASVPIPRIAVPNNLGVVVNSTKLLELEQELDVFISNLEKQGINVM